MDPLALKGYSTVGNPPDPSEPSVRTIRPDEEVINGHD